MKGLNILEALENLNILVDAESLDEIEVVEGSRLVTHKREKEGEHGIYWVHAGPDTETIEAIKETFRTVHEYLRTFYQRMKKTGDTRQVVEGINTIMVLVGEAGQKMDRFDNLFKQRVTDFKEFQDLQHFYRNHVIKETFKEFALTPIAKPKEKEKEIEEDLKDLLNLEEEIDEIAGAHILNDLDVIKRDHLYELFYLKNEAGHRFYTLELARKIKLACDFGEFAEEYFGDDPLLQIKNWEDKALQLQAQKILNACHSQMENFYKEAAKYKELELVASVQKALMALMLAANPRNLIRQFSLKGCYRYFNDFFLFLRTALHDREFQKFLVYSIPPGKYFFQNLYDLIHHLCYSLYTTSPNHQEMKNALKHLIERKEPLKGKHLSENLFHADTALTDVLKKHPNGPVFKALDIIREDEEERSFDPMTQGNLPERAWILHTPDKEMICLRLPAPLEQTWINKAHVTEEFKAFLRELKREERLLLINFQDRTSWKEHARSQELEDLGRQAEFVDRLTVVTLAKDTDFYNQSGHYQTLDEAKEFLDQFRDHLGEESSGYFFLAEIKHALFPKFIDSLLEKIHEVFFDAKSRLSYLERLDFIELTYHFIIIKLIEITKPSLLGMSSKDALDSVSTFNVGLLAILGTFMEKEWSLEEVDALNVLLFGPTLMNRERIIQPERFERLYTMLRLLEAKGGKLDAFTHLYKKEMFASKLVLG